MNCAMHDTKEITINVKRRRTYAMCQERCKRTEHYGILCNKINCVCVRVCVCVRSAYCSSLNAGSIQ